MVAAVNGIGGDGCVRVRAREKEQRGGASRKSERVRGGGVASPGVEEGGREAATAKQEVAGALRARATPRLCLLAEEEEDKGGEGGGLGQREELASWAGYR